MWFKETDAWKCSYKDPRNTLLESLPWLLQLSTRSDTITQAPERQGRLHSSSRWRDLGGIIEYVGDLATTSATVLVISINSESGWLGKWPFLPQLLCVCTSPKLQARWKRMTFPVVVV